MSRASPGDCAWSVLRRDLLRDQRESTGFSGGLPIRCPNFFGKGSYSIFLRHRSIFWYSFTLESSGFRAGRGRLGEVVSLVGDCRPPPPGNPRRPASPIFTGEPVERSGRYPGGSCFTPNESQNGGNSPSVSICSSLYKSQSNRNLKILNITQYFKNRRSFYYCTGKNPVLEFVGLHSHLCGLLGMKPPPIAITNVLETG